MYTKVKPRMVKIAAEALRSKHAWKTWAGGPVTGEITRSHDSLPYHYFVPDKGKGYPSEDVIIVTDADIMEG